MSSLIIWLTNQTPRVFNNSPIQLFCNELSHYEYLIPIYYLDRKVFDGKFKLSGLDRFSKLRKQYTQAFIKSFQNELRELGSDLFIVSEEIEDFVNQINSMVESDVWEKVCLIYTNPDLYEESRWLNKFLSGLSKKVEIISIGDTSTTNISESILYDDRFTPWYRTVRTKYIKYKFVKDPYIKQSLPNTVPISLDKLYYEEVTNYKFVIPCTERQAISRLKDFTNLLSNYGNKRDFFAENLEITNTSLLEGVLSNGVLSRKLVYSSFIELENSEAFTRQLTFYDHNLLLYRKYGAKTWFSRDGIKPSKLNKRVVDLDKFSLLVEAETNTNLINKPLKQLKETGYIHNRLRMIIASYVCNTMRLDHRLGAELFEHHLLGFNAINNQAGWMWCGGLGNDNVPYPGRYFNIVNQYFRYSLDNRVIKDSESLDNRVIRDNQLLIS